MSLDLQLLSDQIKEELDQGIIDAHKKAESTPRRHLGASIIGHECRAYLWFSFRWARIGSNFDARMLRLFNRGHLEESRFVGWLKQAGWEVRELSEDGKQFRMSAVMGHYGGSLDGMACHPRYPELGEVLLEFKTKGTGKGFKELSEKGVKLAAGQHYRQMCQYGSAYSLKYGLYQTINKNDDDLHLEVVELDPALAADDIRRAEDIITSKTRPPRVSESSTYIRCRYCEFSNICHNGDAMDVSCRSCSFATPIEGSNWHCGKWNNTIPLDFVPKGCPEWKELEH